MWVECVVNDTMIMLSIIGSDKLPRVSWSSTSIDQYFYCDMTHIMLASRHFGRVTFPFNKCDLQRVFHSLTYHLVNEIKRYFESKALIFDYAGVSLPSILTPSIAAQEPSVNFNATTVRVDPATVRASPTTVSIDPATMSVSPTTLSIDSVTVSVSPTTVGIDPATVSIDLLATVSVSPATVNADPSVDAANRTSIIQTEAFNSSGNDSPMTAAELSVEDHTLSNPPDQANDDADEEVYSSSVSGFSELVLYSTPPTKKTDIKVEILTVSREPWAGSSRKGLHVDDTKQGIESLYAYRIESFGIDTKALRQQFLIGGKSLTLILDGQYSIIMGLHQTWMRSEYDVGRNRGNIFNNEPYTVCFNGRRLWMRFCVYRKDENPDIIVCAVLRSSCPKTNLMLIVKMSDGSFQRFEMHKDEAQWLYEYMPYPEVPLDVASLFKELAMTPTWISVDLGLWIPACNKSTRTMTPRVSLLLRMPMSVFTTRRSMILI